jgi:hypothetical protein
LRVPDASILQGLIDDLGILKSIEQVYPQPIPINADIPPTTTINLTASQGYTNPAPAGIDVPFARQFPTSRGELIGIIDMETGWRMEHEDLPGPSAVFSWHGVNQGGEHGTAVAGILWGNEDSIGVTGIAPRSKVGWSSAAGAQLFPNPVYSPAAAIVNATADLSPGSIILIEQQVAEWFTGIANPPGQCNEEQVGYLPVEIYGAEFDAISQATAKGIIVVEAAGNGSMNLDGYKEFDRTLRDSGAIMVGASEGAGSNAPACWTNSGRRVDAFSWGGGVATLGYGPVSSLQANGSDARQWYTGSFSGTSSASPIVAGAIAVVQGIRRRLLERMLDPAQMRALIASTGTRSSPPPTGTAPKAIGVQPDLKAALRATLPDVASMEIAGLSESTKPGQALSGTARLHNRGPVEWTAGTHALSCRWQTGESVSVSQIPAAMNFGALTTVSWTSTAPPGEGVNGLICELRAGSNVVGSKQVGTILQATDQYGAELVAFPLPAKSPYGINGATKKPVHVPVKGRNTGTAPWGLQGSPPVALRSWPFGDVTGLKGVAPSGSEVEFELIYECESPGLIEITVVVELSGVAFGNPMSAETQCVGTDNKPT